MKFVEMLVKTFQKMGQNLEFISWTSRWVKYERNKAAFKNVTLCLLMNLPSNILRILALSFLFLKEIH